MSRTRQALLAFFTAFQLWSLASPARGLFSDEGIYVGAGHAVSNGHNFDFSWLGGFPALYPRIAFFCYSLAGVSGARTFSALCCIGACVFFARFADRVVGPSAGTWSLGAFVLIGPLLSLGHLATYDSLALLGFATTASFAVGGPWTSRRVALLSLSASITILAKYTALVPLSSLALFLVAHARGPGLARLGQVVALSGVGLVGIFLVSLGALPTSAADSYLIQERFSPLSTASEVVYHAAPGLLLALWGASVALKRDRGFGIVLLGLALLWPVAHIAVGSRTSLHKHLIFSAFLYYPLVGKGLEELASRSKNLVGGVVVVVALVGLAQSYVQDRLWVETRAVSSFFDGRIQATETVGFQWSWALAPALIVEGTLQRSDQLVDQYSLALRHKGRECELDWIVAYEGGGHEKDEFGRLAKRCGFRAVDSKDVSLWSQRHFIPSHYVGTLNFYQRRASDLGDGF